MTPGRTGGTGTDGERPLEHSVMKRSIENSLVQSAFQMNPVRVLCLIYFGNSHLMYFFLHMYKPHCYRCHISEQFLFTDKYLICEMAERCTFTPFTYIRLAKDGNLHLFTRQLTKIFSYRKPSMHIKTSYSR